MGQWLLSVAAYGLIGAAWHLSPWFGGALALSLVLQALLDKHE